MERTQIRNAGAIPSSELDGSEIVPALIRRCFVLPLGGQHEGGTRRDVMVSARINCQGELGLLYLAVLALIHILALLKRLIFPKVLGIRF